MPDLPKETLPDGWRWEPLYEHTEDVFVADNGATPSPGFVTVSFRKRKFALGRGEPHIWGRFEEGLYDESRYQGRGWRQRLVDDAVKALQTVWGEGE